MDRYLLAQQLRQRQYNIGIVERHLIDSLSDDEIIDCYITCSCCGEKQVNEQNMEVASNMARDADHFLHLCNELANIQHTRGYPVRKKKIPVRTRASYLRGNRKI
jgi:hypothetical protein